MALEFSIIYLITKCRYSRTKGIFMNKKLFKYIIATVTVVMLLAAMIPTASAATAPTIIANPQQPVFAEGARAEYSVKATGSDPSYHWYVIYQGNTYDTESVTNQPWEWHLEAGSYGPSEDRTSYVFNSIPKELDGMKIYCEVRNGGGAVRSYAATVNVKKNATAPSEISVPIAYTFNNVSLVTAKCTVAKDADKCEYLWFESTDGDLKNITELPFQDDASLIVSGEMDATRYYICRVTNKNGGVTYSSPITIKTMWDPTQTTPAPVTTATPETTLSPDVTTAPDVTTEDTTDAPVVTTDIGCETTPAPTGDDTTANDTKPVTTKPSDDTSSQGEDGGCGSAIAAVVLPAVAVAALVSLRRKEN